LRYEFWCECHALRGTHTKIHTWIKQCPERGVPFNGDEVTVTGNSDTLILTLGLDDLLRNGCKGAGDYFRKPDVPEGDRHLCDAIETLISFPLNFKGCSLDLYFGLILPPALRDVLCEDVSQRGGFQRVVC
jgi:hypothetical protein